QLIDLMNDKQRLELQRILKSSEAAATDKVESPANLPLKHIVNLPGSGMMLNSEKPPVQATSPQPQAKPVKPEFAEHLQTLLEEKELPSGPELKQVTSQAKTGSLPVPPAHKSKTQSVSKPAAPAAQPAPAPKPASVIPE